MNKTFATQGKLGTFAGVFTPSVLTIIGIILFLRLGYVVGQSGLPAALLILFLANGISVLTSISLSAIATNLRVKRGGDYYLISRTLGPAWGGAIGIVLFLAQSVSIAFYCLGFGEVFSSMLPRVSWLNQQVIAAIALSFLFIFAWLGTDWATRFQYVVMAILMLAIGSFFFGSYTNWKPEYLAENWRLPEQDFDFWIMFALFFPAVTGFTQGVSMSGELKDPVRSLPLGTFLAVGISILIYFISALAFAAAEPRALLVSDHEAMRRIASSEMAIIAGVFAATLSSAMASFLGAPRILQSLASDRLFRFLLPFARISRKSGNPRRAVLLATAIALLAVTAGHLDVIAPVVSMFFLVSYGLINFATYFESSSGSPAFRPTFKYFNKRLSLAGGVACFGAMLAIDAISGAIAIAILFAVNQYLQHAAPIARWADGRRSYHLQRIREHLLATAKSDPHPRDWRPVLLIFSSAPQPQSWLLQFASWIISNSGFATAVNFIQGRGLIGSRQREKNERDLAQAIADQGVDIFALTVLTPDTGTAINSVVQSSGIGPLKANTILMDWSADIQSQPDAVDEVGSSISRLQSALHLNCNIVLLEGRETGWQTLLVPQGGRRIIDVWWLDDASSRLGLLLAYLITRVDVWEHARIRLLGVSAAHTADLVSSQLAEILAEVRIDAEPVVICDIDSDKIYAASREASLVFMPIRIRLGRPMSAVGTPLHELAQRLPVMALVFAAGDFKLSAEPEEGRAAELALLRDSLEDSGKFAEVAAADLAENEAELESCRTEQATLQEELQQNPEDEDLARRSLELARKIEQLVVLQEKLFRRQARALARRRDAEAAALQAGIVLDDEGDPSGR